MTQLNRVENLTKNMKYEICEISVYFPSHRNLNDIHNVWLREVLFFL